MKKQNSCLEWLVKKYFKSREGPFKIMWFIYIVQCQDESLYTGISTDVQERLERHNKGKGAKYTRSRRPVRLVYVEQSDSKSAAECREQEEIDKIWLLGQGPLTVKEFKKQARDSRCSRASWPHQENKKMRPTDKLKEEHETIKLMLEVLEVFCKKLEAKENVEIEHLDKAIEFIQIFADKCHHGKEEDILFPAIVESGIPKEGGPVAVMLMEHDAGRSFVRALSKAVVNYKQGNIKAADQIVENARNYIALLDEHIFKENNILFPLADRIIPDDKQVDLLNEFEKAEEEKIGLGQHEEFHELLHRLKKIYLS